MAGRAFTYVAPESNQVITIYALSSNINDTFVKVYIDNVIVDTELITPGSYVVKTYDSTLSKFEVISDNDILVHTATDSGGNNTTALAPASNIIYGSVSESSQLGVIGNSIESVSYSCSNGTSGSINTGESLASGGSEYSGISCKYSAPTDVLIGAISSNDGDGDQATTFLPLIYSLMNFQYPLILIITKLLVINHRLVLFHQVFLRE